MAQAKYQEIADRLRDQIDSGLLQPGERLPSEPDLVKMFDASRNTVRLAIALLTNQGLVVTRQGLGTFVNEPTVPFTALLSRVKVQPAGQSQSTLLPEVSNTDAEAETFQAGGGEITGIGQRGRETGDRGGGTGRGAAAARLDRRRPLDDDGLLLPAGHRLRHAARAGR